MQRREANETIWPMEEVAKGESRKEKLEEGLTERRSRGKK